jgi:hypothetical protein
MAFWISSGRRGAEHFLTRRSKISFSRMSNSWHYFGVVLGGISFSQNLPKIYHIQQIHGLRHVTPSRQWTVRLIPLLATLFNFANVWGSAIWKGKFSETNVYFEMYPTHIALQQTQRAWFSLCHTSPHQSLVPNQSHPSSAEWMQRVTQSVPHI